VADILGYLGDLSVHRLLVGGHCIELGVQLVDGLVKCLIGLRWVAIKRSVRLSKYDVGWGGGGGRCRELYTETPMTA